MTENEFLLEDRRQKIKSTIEHYGEENFYLSFSGGKDSTVLSWLLDFSLPGNQIPRVFADTGIELKLIRDFVLKQHSKDSRVVVIKPSVPIKRMLEKYGYPFKSKEHSYYVNIYQRKGLIKTPIRYLNGIGRTTKRFTCPKILRYQFTPENKLKISDRCCLEMKEEPLRKYEKEFGRKYAILGLMREEGGRRSATIKCLSWNKGGAMHFNPLMSVSGKWIDWVIKTFNIEICDIYKAPYNFQ